MNKMMNQRDFRTIILEQQAEETGFTPWEGTLVEYLSEVAENPNVANFAPGRIYNMIMKFGTEDVDAVNKIRGYEDLVKYKFFDGKIFGSLEPLHDLMKFFKAAARRTETGKRILLLMGPVSSGKSTIANLIKKGLEKDDTPKYVIEGCPIHEEPMHSIPEEHRPFWENKLGVKIEGFLCPHCQFRMDNELKKLDKNGQPQYLDPKKGVVWKDSEGNVVNELRFKDAEGKVLWEQVPVEKIQIREQKRQCIGTFQPSDPKSQDITELIGRVNMAKLDMYGETDPRAYQFDGELQVANGGMIEYIEILKADIKFHYVLISAAQEQLIKSPGFPQMFIDTCIFGHTNQTEYDKFKANKENEALHDRTYLVKVPWNLKVDDEIKIYEKMIAESDFRDIHIAPWALKIAAQFAVLSRLTKSTKVTSMVEKMKLYNGEITDEFKKTEIDVKALKQEGRENGEGMSGISPRFIINAMNIALGMNEDKGIERDENGNPKMENGRVVGKFKDADGKRYRGCVNPIDLIRAIRNNFEHAVGIKEEDAKHFDTLLTGQKHSVASEFKEYAQEAVNMSFLYAYKDQAAELFRRYMENVSAFCKKQKIKDSVTGEYSDPDEKLMRSLEEIIQVPENGKEEFRNGIFVHKADALELGKPFGFEDYPPIKKAINKKLQADLKNVVNLSIATPDNTNPKAQEHRNRAFDNLKDQGYCDCCAEVLLKFVGEVLRKT
jgi:serine protein kinase